MTALLLILALAAITGEYLGLRWLVYAAKPLATIAVILLAARAEPPLTPQYRTFITIGLVASLAGDVLLMMPGDLFVPGLASFLVAHLFYITAFQRTGGGARDPLAFLVIAVAAAAILAVLWPALGAMRLPVGAYVAVIATMAWQAVARWRHLRDARAAMAAAGAILFMASDSAIAVGRFLSDFPGSRAFVLSTYWAAQYLIASSVRSPARG